MKMDALLPTVQPEHDGYHGSSDILVFFVQVLKVPVKTILNHFQPFFYFDILLVDGQCFPHELLQSAETNGRVFHHNQGYAAGDVIGDHDHALCYLMEPLLEPNDQNISKLHFKV